MREDIRQEERVGRTMADRAGASARRRQRDAALVVALTVVLLFAVVGVVSAGSFVAGKVAGSATSTPAPHPRTKSNSLAAQELNRAHAQATAIVKQAQAAGRSILSAAQRKSKAQAHAVVAAARKQAAASRPAPAPAPAASSNVAAPSTSGGLPSPSAPTPSSSANSPTTGGTYASGTYGAGLSNAGSSRRPSGAVSNAGPGTKAAPLPNLHGVPASWLVVGYNASFGSGPGTAGSISVINRSGKTFSGVATVKYANGGSASAYFSGLAPGQALTLPLSGARYRGGGYQITMNGLH